MISVLPASTSALTDSDPVRSTVSGTGKTGTVTVRYYGFFSNKSRGMRQKVKKHLLILHRILLSVMTSGIFRWANRDQIYSSKSSAPGMKKS
jgi:hypothetical protein